MSKTIFVLNGPNLNLLGTREPEIYGSETLEDIGKKLQAQAQQRELNVDMRQSNSEGELVDWIQEANQAAAGIIINAAAYTHTSIALLDALKAIDIPCVEVHLSNIFKRETFRHHSHISPHALGVICGFGSQGYEFALAALASRLK